MSTEDVVVCVDLGKSRCRVVLRGPAGEIAAATGQGLPGLAVVGAAERTAQVLRAMITQAAPTVAPTSFGIGAAGALTAPDGAAELARLLAAAYAAPAAVASDIVTAHVGALDGEPGVCLVVGTGAVALGVAADGRTSRRDGLGLLTGDVGSGAWIGRAGLRAAEMAAAGAAPTSRLADLIVPDGVAPGDDGQTAARLARHAPAVLVAAQEGDATAAAIIATAVSELAATAHAAARATDQSEVSVLGGLTGSDWFLSQLASALSARGLTTHAPAGTALDGAHIIATRHDLPLKGLIHRA